MAIIESDISKAEDFLRKGKLIGMPTETVYGLAGNALDLNAVGNIFKVKNRPKFDPLILHFSGIEKALHFTDPPTLSLQKLIDKFVPGPLTILLPKKSSIDDLITAGLDRVAVRIPTHPLTNSLLDRLDFPVAAPSANPFGYISPTAAQHVDEQLGHKVPFILDGGACQVGIESTIVGEEEGKVIVYRKGGVSIEEIEKVIGSVIVTEQSSSQPAAPGMLHSHYAPKKTTSKYFGEEIRSDTAYILFKRNEASIRRDNVFYLSENGNLLEAAKNLFKVLREADKTDYKNIQVEMVPEVGLGRAINDRLARATI